MTGLSCAQPFRMGGSPFLTGMCTCRRKSAVGDESALDVQASIGSMVKLNSYLVVDHWQSWVVTSQHLFAWICKFFLDSLSDFLRSSWPQFLLVVLPSKVGWMACKFPWHDQSPTELPWQGDPETPSRKNFPVGGDWEAQLYLRPPAIYSFRRNVPFLVLACNINVQNF